MTEPTNTPRIYLAIDNCFASKRWTRPAEWMAIVRDLGLRFVEASADNECDPLYAGPAYLPDWIRQVQDAEAATGVKVASLYSGHGTYATLGLGHTDSRVRDRMLNDWLLPMKRNAGALGAALGFFCHAFPDSVLQDPAAYDAARDDLVDRLAQVAAMDVPGCPTVGVEQMYSPHQIPWTLPGAEELLRAVYRKSSTPFYITIDTGHQVGQRRFLRPDADAVKGALRQGRSGKRTEGLWLGPRAARDRFHDAVTRETGDDDAAAREILAAMEPYPYLFAHHGDGDPYRWLSRLAAHSPIIHLQQTDGTSSSHWAFTQDRNRQGIIEPGKVLAAIRQAYDRAPDPTLPPPVDTIYLTLEMFSGTADHNSDILARLQESIACWRRFVPVDGQPLHEIVERHL